ncbi:MAG: tetratricopeptide repeat protein [Myxococcota bacterium]
MIRSTATTLALSLSVLLWLGAAASAEEITPPWDEQSVLSDPEWRKRFLGSYGFLSGAEPSVSGTELELLREVIDLMQANPRAAEARLVGVSGGTSSAALDFVLANLQFQNGNTEKAAKTYELALSKFPDFRRAHKNLGLVRVQGGDFAGAAEHLARAVELGDRDGKNFGLLGYCHLNLENYVAAEEAYRSAILQEPETQDWQLGLARALLSMEKYEEAAAHFSSLIEKNPQDATLWLLQANAYVGLEKPEEAAVNLEAVRLLGKAQTSSLVLLGDIYMNAGMPEFAKSAYLEVVRTDQSGTQFHAAYRAADLLIRTGSHRDAEEVLASIDKRYESLSKDDELKVLTLKAKVARALGRKKEAANLLESIVGRDGTRGEALLELARYRKGQGEVDRALLLLERAQNLDGFEYAALLERAQLLVTRSDYTNAAQLLREALQIRDEPRVQRFLARVEEAARGT